MAAVLTLRRKLILALAASGVAGLVALSYVASDDGAPSVYHSPELGAVSLRAQAFPPLLPLPQSGDVPSLAAAARDPEAARHEPDDDAGARGLAEEIKQMRADLGHAQGPRVLELHQQAAEGYASLAYFLEDVATGRRQSGTDKAHAESQLAAIQGYLLQHATALTKLGDDRAKARGYFYVYSVEFAQGERGKAVAGLRALGKQKLDQGLKRRVALLLAIHDIDHGTAAEKSSAVQTLKTQAASLAAPAQVAVRLVLARSLAGLSAGFHKVGPAKDGYRSQLAAAAQRASAFPAEQKSAVLGVVVGIWRAAEGAKIDWNKVPFKMGPYANELAVKGIVERSALADWAQSRKPQALRKYASLAKNLAGQPQRSAIDLRILDLRRAEYQADKSAKPYEAALIAANKVYLEPGALGDGNEAKVKQVAAEITKRHAALVQAALAHAATKQASAEGRQTAIAMAGKYIATLTDGQAIEDVKAKVAGIYALAGQHRQAVTLYQELAETTKGDARRFWALAIKSQTVLAQWSEEAPWQGFKSGAKAAEREQLLGLYGKLGEASAGKNAWFVAAQVGLLDISLGKTEAAFDLWKGQLAKDQSGPHAANAAGTMLSAYQKAANWSELEALSRLCLAHRVAAVFRGAPVSGNEMLALALLEGGKQALAASNFDVAVGKLQEFVAQHAKAKNHDEGFFLLAVAQHGGGHHEDAIKTLLAFEARYSASKYNRQALLDGGDWSAPMAYEENVMFFYNRFIKKFAADAESPRVRQALTELYLGRGRYADALAVLGQSARQPGLTGAARAEVLATIMDIEERNGSISRAALAADQLARMSDAPDEKRAPALALKARLAAQAGRFAEVKQIADKLQTMQSPAAQDALGEARYLLAVAQAQSVVKTYFNLALRDPRQTIAQRYTAFKGARAGYQSVCAAGETSFCAPAMLKLDQLSLDFMKSLEDVTIQETLAKAQVDEFNSYKQSIMNDASHTSESADGQALAAVGAGHTDPDWTEAVLWQNTADWNFDRVTGETGNGYVQWTTSDGAAAAANGAPALEPAPAPTPDDVPNASDQAE